MGTERIFLMQFHLAGTQKMADISWEDFEKVDLRAGTIIEARPFPEARKPAYQLTIDFGEKIGIRKSSAQITDLYSLDELVGKQIIGVVNFPRKQIGPFMSECLVTGLVRDDGQVILAVPDKFAENGTRLG
jgi:tRNA-binding protein